MRNILPKFLRLFIAATIFMSPLIVLANDSCHCSDCAHGTCIVKSELCSAEYCSQEVSQCCRQNEPVSGISEAGTRPTEDLSTEESGHKSPVESKDCRCSTYLAYSGYALLPAARSNVYSTAGEFYQHAPTAFATSSWVYLTFHPPR